jgi:hypothetical protein
VAEGLGHGGLARGRSPDEDDVAVLVDESAREELLDDLGGELGPRGPVEAVEGEGRAELAPAAAALELALPAGAVLGFEDLAEEARVRRLRRLGLREELGEAAGGGGEVELLEADLESP